MVISVFVGDILIKEQFTYDDTTLLIFFFLPQPWCHSMYVGFHFFFVALFCFLLFCFLFILHIFVKFCLRGHSKNTSIILVSVGTC